MPEYKKKFNTSLIAREFVKGKSVFARWQEDNLLIYDNCLKHDFKFWKCRRFVKDTDDYQQVCEIVRKNFGILKDNHIYTSCTSAFPSTNLNEFTSFARKCNLIGTNLSSSTLDRLFIAANVEI